MSTEDEKLMQQEQRRLERAQLKAFGRDPTKSFIMYYFIIFASFLAAFLALDIIKK